MERLRIIISFKNSSLTDLELYNWLMSMEDKSHEIKKMLKRVLEEEKNNGNNSN